MATLPDDLLEIICVRAALEDRYAAYALALTSHDICRWTAKARWCVVVIRSVRQLLSFWRAVYAVPDEIFQAFSFQLEQSSECSFVQTQSMLARQNMKKPLGAASDRLTKGLSFPADGKPHKYVRHLYIDTSADTSLVDGHASHTSMTALKRAGLLFMSTSVFQRSDFLSDPSRILNRWTGKDRTTLAHLSLGVDETDALDWGALHDLSVDELTLVLRKDYSGDLHVDMTPNVGRLHLVGQDPKSELTGVEPPWTLLRCLASPILSTTMSVIPALSHRKLTHIRYDTRRFSFKPAEITAKRLRPLLQECTIAPPTLMPPPFTDTHHGTGRDVAAAFQFTGPRHAAPARGAGSYTMQHHRSHMTPVHHLANRHGEEEPVACFLDNIGVGRLDLVRFAWEPMSPSMETPSASPWYKRSPNDTHGPHDHRKPELPASIADGLSSDSGGWPLEMRGAWAERSEKRSAIAAFTHELRDAIHTLYGWQAARMPFEDETLVGRRNVAFSAEDSGLMVEAAQAGIAQQDEDELRHLAMLVKANVPNWRHNHPEWAEDDTDFLRFGIRAPHTLLRLGGKAAFTSDDRLKLFEDRARGGQGSWPT